jgi:hypothetical protein
MTGRPINTATKLALRMRETGKPLYVIAGEVGISYPQMTAYSSGRKQILSHHMIKLCDFFECEPDEIWGPAE